MDNEPAAAEELLKNLPSVETILTDERLSSWYRSVPRRLVRTLVRSYLDELRKAIRQGEAGQFSWTALQDYLEQQALPSLRRAINAVGVVLHTGMGRAVLSARAREALAEVTENFCNLAIERSSGRRGERYTHVAGLLRELTGAEDAVVVNNNAGATLLILNTLAADREVIVSRGQLVEIGGAFRMPDIMLRSGVKMVEVGTTNRTHLNDYRTAITPNTALLMRVHTSNYRIIGFTKEVSLAELVALGKEFRLPVVDDLGSGALVDLSKYGLPKEPTVQESIAAGADVVCFSGDKLVGGPQCGIIVGRRELVQRMKKNPLTRALRCCKLTYAALEATLRLFLDEEQLLKEHPVMLMLLKPTAEIARQARAFMRATAHLRAQAVFELQDATSEVGSGSLATDQLPTKVVAVRPVAFTAEELARRLRYCRPPVFTRIRDQSVLFDFRTIRRDETALVAQALEQAFAQPAGS